MPVYNFTVDQRRLNDLAKTLRKEADGKQLRKDLIRQLKQPLAPLVAEIKAGVMSMPSTGISAAGEPLRPAVAKMIKAEVKLSGRATGVRIRARKTPGVRNFANAPKRINSPKGWRHPVWGSDTWVNQRGKPNYFDDPIKKKKREFRNAVRQTMEETARRIAERTRG